jgi:hypothetical protein
MKTQISVLTLMLIFSIAAVVTAHTADDPYTTDLIAGQTADVGDVLVWNDETTLYVQYKIADDTTPDDYTDNWAITKTHVHVATAWEAIPQKNGNPIPGQFAYKNNYANVNETPPLAIPLLDEWEIGETLYIAAHADVEIAGGLDGIEMYLPDTVTMSVAHPGGSSYFNVTITDTILDGTYSGWCVDTEQTITPGSTYTANVYSSYETISGLVDKSENMDLVNWVLNQHYVGQDVQDAFPGTLCTGIITYGDVQRAIWTLIENTQSTSGLGPWEQCRVDEIVAAAEANGEGYEPGCGDIVAIILAPVDGQGNIKQTIIAQVIIAELPIFCETVDETAWGQGFDFPGSNWAMYFTYIVQ